MMNSTLPLDTLVPLVNESLDDSLSRLESYASHQQREDLEEAVNSLNRVRGASTMLRFRSAADLCSLLNEYVSNDADLSDTAASDFVGTQLQSLRSYFELQTSLPHVVPELLQTNIDSILKVLKRPALPISYYHGARQDLSPIKRSSQHIEHRAEILLKLRKMYQYGVSQLIKSSASNAHLTIIERASQRLAMISNDRLALVWAMVYEICLGLAQTDIELPMPIKRTFLQLDRLLSKMVKSSEGESIEVPNQLVYDLTYLLRMSYAETGSSKLCAFLKLDPLAYSISEFTAYGKRLLGPDRTTNDTVTKLYLDDLHNIADLVSVTAETEITTENIERISSALNRLASTAYLLCWPVVRARLLGCAGILAETGIDICQEKLGEILHSIIVVETLVARYKDGVAAEDEELGDEYVTVAQRLVYEEIRRSFALAKRGLSSYIESDFDTVHIANVPSALMASAGALYITSEHSAANMVRFGAEFIQQQLIESSPTSATQQLMGHFADSLVALELYIQLAADDQQDPEVLKLALQSLTALGYAG